jgi:hypothetical protein
MFTHRTALLAISLAAIGSQSSVALAPNAESAVPFTTL